MQRQRSKRAWRKTIRRLRGSRAPAHNAETICKKVARRRKIRIRRSGMLWVKVRSNGKLPYYNFRAMRRYFPLQLQRVTREIRSRA